MLQFGRDNKLYGASLIIASVINLIGSSFGKLVLLEDAVLAEDSHLEMLIKLKSFVKKSAKT